MAAVTFVCDTLCRAPSVAENEALICFCFCPLRTARHGCVVFVVAESKPWMFCFAVAENDTLMFLCVVVALHVHIICENQ